MKITAKESSKTLYGVLPIHNSQFEELLRFHLDRIEDLGIKYSFNTAYTVGEEVFKLDGVTWVTCEVPEESVSVLANRKLMVRKGLAYELQQAAQRYLAEEDNPRPTPTAQQVNAARGKTDPESLRMLGYSESYINQFKRSK